MEYAKLGNSDLKVSRICLGCMGFGDSSTGQHSWTVGEGETRKIIRMALDESINFFDTAIAYQTGTAEGASLKLSDSEIDFLEEPYVPHEIVGVMAQNTAASSHEEHVWESANKGK